MIPTLVDTLRENGIRRKIVLGSKEKKESFDSTKLDVMVVPMKTPEYTKL